MNPMLNIATRAARNAGNVILRAIDRLDQINVSQKQFKNFVSDIDRQAEQEIINVISKTYPQHKIIAEESGESLGDNENVWIIDPLDGTNNYIHGFPHFAVSIAFQHQDKILHGLIYDPIRQELFTASRGEGARLNNRRIRVSSQTKFENAFIATGFPVRVAELIPPHFDILKNLVPQILDLRVAGSAALDLAYVAAGRVDGYWESSLKPWDMAAGALLVQEAGGLVADLDGANSYLEKGNIIAANPTIFKGLLRYLQTAKV